MIGITLLIVGILIVGIWLVLEIKRLKHRVLAILFIGIILFVYVSGYYVFNGTNIDYGSISGLTEATKLYVGWFFSVGGNFIDITNNIIKMDWKGNLE